MEDKIQKAFRTIYNRIKEIDDIPNGVTRTCGNCKYCHGQEGYNQEWGYAILCS